MDDLRLLRVLREVARHRSFSAAAERLAYSQPAVSQQIARLEKQVGVQLVIREPRTIRLTPAGEALVRHSERLFAQLAEAEAELAQITAEARGRLRLGSFPTAAGTVVPSAFADFRERRPAVELRLEVREDALPLLRADEVDVALVIETDLDRPEVDPFASERLFDDPLLAVLPAGHPLATRRALSLEELRREDWMLGGIPGTCPDSNVVLSACAEAGFEPNVHFRSDDYFAVQGLVASRMGVALMPRLALASRRDDVVVIPLRGRPPMRRVVAAWRPETPAPVQDMLVSLRGAAADLAAESAPARAAA
ncbi:MAG TPA: LysR family transcriptional regulator [Thermoleophilaceae bacterium]|nr:LysR family transcriptional regulator [Thermoleophilaceae bacterium]